MIKDISITIPHYKLASFLGEQIKEIPLREEWSSASMELRSVLSISNKISIRLRTKALSKEGSPDKPVKIKLSYEQAYGLYMILLTMKDKFNIDPEDYYLETVIQDLINKLHQKLI